MFISKQKEMRTKKNLPTAQEMSLTSLGPLFRSLFLLSWPEHRHPATPVATSSRSPPCKQLLALVGAGAGLWDPWLWGVQGAVAAAGHGREAAVSSGGGGW